MNIIMNFVPMQLCVYHRILVSIALAIGPVAFKCLHSTLNNYNAGYIVG